MNEETIKKVEAILMKYCNPKKEYDQVPPKQVATEIIEVVQG